MRDKGEERGDKVDSQDQGNEGRGRRGKKERIRMRDATFSGMSRGGKRRDVRGRRGQGVAVRGESTLRVVREGGVR